MDREALCMKIFMVMLIMSIGLCAAAITPAQEQETKKAGRAIKGVSGEVSGIGKDFISVVYHRDEEVGIEKEIMFPISKTIIVEHKQNISQISLGDLVDIEFQEVTEESQNGIKTKLEAKVIRFVRSAQKKPQTFKRPEPGEDLPDDIVVGK